MGEQNLSISLYPVPIIVLWWLLHLRLQPKSGQHNIRGLTGLKVLHGAFNKKCRLTMQCNVPLHPIKRSRSCFASHKASLGLSPCTRGLQLSLLPACVTHSTLNTPCLTTAGWTSVHLHIWCELDITQRKKKKKKKKEPCYCIFSFWQDMIIIHELSAVLQS